MPYALGTGTWRDLRWDTDLKLSWFIFLERGDWEIGRSGSGTWGLEPFVYQFKTHCFKPFVYWYCWEAFSDWFSFCFCRWLLGNLGLVVMSILLVIMVLSRAWDFLGIYSAFLYIFCCIIIIKYFFCGGCSSCFLNLLWKFLLFLVFVEKACFPSRLAHNTLVSGSSAKPDSKTQPDLWSIVGSWSWDFFPAWTGALDHSRPGLLTVLWGSFSQRGGNGKVFISRLHWDGPRGLPDISRGAWWERYWEELWG